MASGGVPERAGMLQQIPDLPDELDGATATFMGIVSKHARFLNEVSKLQVCHSVQIVGRKDLYIVVLTESLG